MSFSRHLLVDGSNILHAWPELAALLKRDPDSARSQLVQQLAAIHDFEAVQLTIVFDGRGEKLSIEHPSRQASLAVVYTPSSVTADSVIEQLVSKAVLTTACVVATDDRAERETVRAAGAEVVTSRDLAAWTERTASRVHGRLKTRMAENERNWRQQP